jgi:peptidoglycan/xylan/chitin deacetylase (PgdA/CDA1 family)
MDAAAKQTEGHTGLKRHRQILLIGRRWKRGVRAISLMYHDVVESGDTNSSGFPGRAPSRYKLDSSLFVRHLGAIARARTPPTSVARLAETPRGRFSPPLFLTFDDGGASARTIGETLAGMGWTGHFFIPVDFIGKPGFLDEAGIVALVQMGHVIGTHSCSHTVPMSRLADERLLEEWRRSAAVLSEIAGTSVVTGSIPGGYVSRRVVEAAAACGIRVLFTSEPVESVREIEGCLLLGRYAILAGTPPGTAARLARGDLGPRLRQLACWRAKGLAKVALGNRYRTLRSALLGTV